MSKTRAVGDSSVWLYYFKAIGPSFTIITIVLGACVQSLETLPGAQQHHTVAQLS